MRLDWHAISRRQNMETGILIAIAMAIALMSYSGDRQWVLWVVTIDLSILLIWPTFFKPITFVWFGLASLLSIVFSKVILAIVFIVIVVPVGMIRRMLGKDKLMLTGFRKGKDSVFQIRDHLYSPADFENTF